MIWKAQFAIFDFYFAKDFPIFFDTPQTLVEGLEFKHKLFRQLAWQQLEAVSRKSLEKRKQIFCDLESTPTSLSKIVECFVTEMKDLRERILNIEEKKVQPKTRIESKSTIFINSKDEKPASPVPSIFQVPKKKPEAVFINSKETFTSSFLKSEFGNLISTFLLKRRQQEIACDSQAYIWSIRAICQLCVASYEEDNYGQMQQAIRIIVDTLNSTLSILQKYAYKLRSPRTMSSKEEHSEFYQIISVLEESKALVLTRFKVNE